MQIPFYCGNDPRCRLHNNQWALSKAIETVEQNYTVVAVLEKMVFSNGHGSQTTQFFQRIS